MVEISPKQNTPRVTEMVDSMINRQKIGWFGRRYLDNPGKMKILSSLTGGAALATIDRALSYLTNTVETVFLAVLVGVGLGWMITLIAGAKAEKKNMAGELSKFNDKLAETERSLKGAQKRIDDLEGHIVAVGKVINGKYRVEAKLGEGGFGTAWLVHDINMDRKNVIKIANSGIGFQLELYQAECRILAQLKHPNIVSVTSWEFVDGMPAFVMEYVDGNSLEQSIAKKEIGAVTAVDIMLQLLNGIEAANGGGIVHRDLKPANIMLDRNLGQDPNYAVDVNGQPCVVKILDFGIAKHHNASGEKTQMSFGTPFYMSPEQFGAGNRPSDFRSDLWAFGMLFWETLFGKTPFRPADGETDLKQQILKVMVNVMKSPLPKIGILEKQQLEGFGSSAENIWLVLESAGFINNNGVVLPKFDTLKNGQVNMRSLNDEEKTRLYNILFETRYCFPGGLNTKLPDQDRAIIQAFFEKILAKNPDERFQSHGEVRNYLHTLRKIFIRFDKGGKPTNDPSGIAFEGTSVAPNPLGQGGR